MDGTCTVATEPLAESSAQPNPVSILSTDTIDHSAIQRSLMQWQVGGCLQYALPIDGVSHPDVTSIVTKMVNAGSFDGCRLEDALSVKAADMTPALQQLERCGCVACAPRGAFVDCTLTDLACKRLHSSYTGMGSVPFFDVGGGVGSMALEDKTTYELLRALTDSGWTWQQWVPPSKRPKRLRLAWPDGHTPESPCIFYSAGARVIPEYLQCLHQAKEP